jgi:hypothetical protein
MISIQPNQLAGLEWRQPGAFSRTYELKSVDSLLARLEFKKTFGTLAVAESAAGRWTFKRCGFLTPVVTARVEGSDADIASYTPNFTSTRGTLRLASGETLDLKTTNFWGSEWALFDANRQQLVRFHNKGMIHHGADVDVSPAAGSRSDLDLLLTISWYILVMHMQDAAATTAVISS